MTQKKKDLESMVLQLKDQEKRQELKVKEREFWLE